MPGFPEYRFNVARGVLPGGRFGVLLHQLLEVPVTAARRTSAARSTGRSSSSRKSWWRPSFNRTDIPFIGDFLDPPETKGEPEAFESNAVWIPTTTVAINVPEAVLPFFLARIDRRAHHAPFDFPHRESLARRLAAARARRRSRRCASTTCSTATPTTRSFRCWSCAAR